MRGTGFTRGWTGRADLARARRFGDPELVEFLAGMLDYRFVAPEPPTAEPPVGIGGEVSAPVVVADPPPIELGRFPFWRAESFKVRVRPEEERSRTSTAATKITSRDRDERKPADVSFAPLASDASLLTRLRAASPSREIGGEIDVDRIVEEWGRGRLLEVMPRRARKVWGRSVQVLVDRSRRLVPYWDDQDRAFLALRDTYPPEGLSTVVMPEGDFAPETMHIAGRSVAYAPPPAGSVLVALSDLGVLAPRGSRLVALWAERGRWLRDLSVLPLAVVPCRRAACPEALDRSWTILPWETGPGSAGPALGDDEADALVERILTLLSFTLRIEPQLIRFVRRLLAEGRGDPALESRVWQHDALGDPHCEAAELPRSNAAILRPALALEHRDLRQKVYDRVKESRRGLYEGIGYTEIGNLAGDELVDAAQLRQAREWFERQKDQIESGAAEGSTHSLLAWQREVSERVLPAAVQNPIVGPILQELWAIAHRDDPHAVPPAGADPIWLQSGSGERPDETESLIELRQRGDRLVARRFLPATANEPSPRPDGVCGSLIGVIRTRNGRIKIRRPDDFWAGGVPPSWAVNWDWDPHGAWATLRVDDVTQRLRWIPPGRFLMGSPEEEAGRWADEGPRHEVKVETGFWMFDTPCTQALWQAVMGGNPSEFQSSTRPVEQVSWNDCQEFVAKLNARFEDLTLSLPPESQWEYACRAGTTAATYAGDLEILGANNAPVLDPIAWYGGNCGVNFELSNGYDLSNFPETQYDEPKGGTHPVGLKEANPWGLFDMLGNVWEWCESPWTDDYMPGRKPSAQRVIRGGSWGSYARNVRAAYRDVYDPTFRRGSLGFRCAEFKSPGPAGRSQDAERAVSGSESGRSPSGDREPASGAGWLRPAEHGEDDSVAISAIDPLRVWTDVEELTLRPVTWPEWASAIGRDRFGLWAEFTIDMDEAREGGKSAVSGKVRQRLRWIPPGRFLMGSPEGEAGRAEWEGPQHEVRFATGFWMFATPCTQALWMAIMAKNPSEFASPSRPVEGVTWDDCQEFMKQLNARLAGLTLSLPSESQWEYACRAGTTAATYAGDLEILGKRNAPVLDAIAWYGGNCGEEFELSKGFDISGWVEKQYESTTGGTHRVGLKEANPWGLYDMLGNVWEWCESPWTDDLEREPSARRVIRGGSWGDLARYVRAAYRYVGVDPSDRSDDLGFRCAEFKQGSRDQGGDQASRERG